MAIIRIITVFTGLLYSFMPLYGKTDKYRCMWRDDPSSSMVIGWNQISGSNPVLYYDSKDHGVDFSKYAFQKTTDRISDFHEMNSHFARLVNLKPNTEYFFIIKDSEGVSRRMSFKTVPNDPSVRISVIAGGDSRNQREACKRSNLLVGKLHPHFVMFGGDMTESDNSFQWKQWLDDWQYTISSEGRLTPVMVTRGNHEYTNKTLVELFDLAAPNVYYKFKIGGNLLSVYTLNTLISAAGDQRDWLQTSLANDQNMVWKIAQYHFPMRPHTKAKMERNDEMFSWASLFLRYSLNLAVESDAHVAKITYPIKPFLGPTSDEGFVRDDERGTVYVGEGGWGAPLRENNDDKDWTMASGSFNHFNWLWIDQNALQVRTVKTDNAEQVEELSVNNVFAIPANIKLWKMADDVVYTITRKIGGLNSEALAARGNDIVPPGMMQLTPDKDNKIKFAYILDRLSDLDFVIYDLKDREVLKSSLPTQAPGKYERFMEIKTLPPGRYLFLVRANKKLIQKYFVLKS